MLMAGSERPALLARQIRIHRWRHQRHAEHDTRIGVAAHFSPPTSGSPQMKDKLPINHKMRQKRF